MAGPYVAFTLNTLPCLPRFFFFQAEDGIRDLYVTGVQTCALPISRHDRPRRTGTGDIARLLGRGSASRSRGLRGSGADTRRRGRGVLSRAPDRRRAEARQTPRLLLDLPEHTRPRLHPRQLDRTTSQPRRPDTR